MKLFCSSAHQFLLYLTEQDGYRGRVFSLYWFVVRFECRPGHQLARIKYLVVVFGSSSLPCRDTDSVSWLMFPSCFSLIFYRHTVILLTHIVVAYCKRNI